MSFFQCLPDLPAPPLWHVTWGSQNWGAAFPIALGSKCANFGQYRHILGSTDSRHLMEGADYMVTGRGSTLYPESRSPSPSSTHPNLNLFLNPQTLKSSFHFLFHYPNIDPNVTPNPESLITPPVLKHAPYLRVSGGRLPQSQEELEELNLVGLGFRVRCLGVRIQDEGSRAG